MESSINSLEARSVRTAYLLFMFPLLMTSVISCSDVQMVTPANEINMPDETDIGVMAAVHPPEFPELPADFVSGITNPYLAFDPGKTFYYEGETDEGTETIIVNVTTETKMIMGVSTTVVRDRVYLDGELIEDTHDWFAQDKDGNVWYFGEDSKEIEDGEVVSTEGSWEAGVDGALPGLIMPADPQNGMKYQQEYLEDVAEDMGIVINTDKTVEIGMGTFEGCLETQDYTPLEPGHREHKYYHPGTGLILEISPAGGRSRIELVAVE